VKKHFKQLEYQYEKRLTRQTKLKVNVIWLKGYTHLF